MLPLSFALLALAIDSGPAAARTVEEETRFGSIELVVETRTRDPGEPPIMHVATEWTKLRLRWRPKTGDMRVDLIDDGGGLRIEGRGHDCLSAAQGQRYGKRLGEAALWNALRAHLDSLMAVCPRISPRQARTYRQAFAMSRDDYVAAIEAMKKRALTLFRRPLMRCKAWTQSFADPFSGRCAGEW
ncbi:MAG: hypothetical protein ABW023_14445 [Sphingomonas sp.]